MSKVEDKNDVAPLGLGFEWPEKETVWVMVSGQRRRWITKRGDEWFVAGAMSRDDIESAYAHAIAFHKFTETSTLSATALELSVESAMVTNDNAVIPIGIVILDSGNSEIARRYVR